MTTSEPASTPLDEPELTSGDPRSTTGDLGSTGAEDAALPADDQAAWIPSEDTDGRDESVDRGAVSLILGALGVVFGDIGTSPLYAIREAFGPAGRLSSEPEVILGLLSVVFWTLMLTVTIKYLVLIMRADNKGEGGVLALAALAMHGLAPGSRWRSFLLVLSIAGLALFFGDALITPAISVMSALEGINAATPAFSPYILPASGVILVGLFLIQSRGTALVGRLFGPVMLLWFAVLAVLGGIQVFAVPSVLVALDPRYALGFFALNPVGAFVSLGAVVLAITGSEALYADMGHFGRRPIRIAWFVLVFPALLLNYFGQGALLLQDPAVVDHVFFLLAPAWTIYPLVILATLATIIASQAVISGLFSLTRQAVQLGYLPRMEMRHTSETEEGQIFVPKMNWILLAGVIFLVSEFRSSNNLAAAYGLAVTGVMGISTILAAVVAVRVWGWGRWLVIAVFGPLLLIDLAFFAANCLKIPYGGWLPILVGCLAYLLVDTWRRGVSRVRQKIYGEAMPLALFLDGIKSTTVRVQGTAVYMTRNINTVPMALLHNLKHNQALHKRIIVMTINIEDEPHVPPGSRIEVERLGKGFFTVAASLGFMDRTNVLRVLAQCRNYGLSFNMMETSFFIGRETLVKMRRARARRDKLALGPWRASLFNALWNSSLSATAFFRLPPGRVVELGGQIEI
ncbi:MAG: potassium transporter Kup [Rhodospirillales bacterium]